MEEYSDIRNMVQKLITLNEEQWEKFLNKYERLIYDYINKAIKMYHYRATEEDKDDIYGEVIEILVKKIWTVLNFNDLNIKRFVAWIRTVTINHTIDYFRIKIKPEIENNDITTRKDTYTNPFKKLLLTELEEIVSKILGPNESLIVLYKKDGYTFAEITKIMDSDYKTHDISNICILFKFCGNQKIIKLL